MWYPANITAAAAAEPVSIDEARLQCSVNSDETEFDGLLNRLIGAARAHVEAYCAVRFASQTVAVKCDAFADMQRLPEAPVNSITGIEYVDTAGDAQTLSTGVYELRSDGLEAQIILQYGQSWPSIRSGSRITLTAVVGMAAVPESVKHAMLIYIADAFLQRENTKAPEWSALDVLLSNHRRGV